MIDFRRMDEELHILKQWESIPEKVYRFMHNEQIQTVLAHCTILLGYVEVLWLQWDAFAWVMQENLKVVTLEERERQAEAIQELRGRVGGAIRTLARIVPSETVAKPGDTIRFIDMLTEKRRCRRRGEIVESWDGGWDVQGYGWLVQWWPVEVMKSKGEQGVMDGWVPKEGDRVRLKSCGTQGKVVVYIPPMGGDPGEVAVRLDGQLHAPFYEVADVKEASGS